jgi:hypothetical protein
MQVFLLYTLATPYSAFVSETLELLSNDDERLSQMVDSVGKSVGKIQVPQEAICASS